MDIRQRCLRRALGLHKMGAVNGLSLQVPAVPGVPSQVGAVPPKESPKALAEKVQNDYNASLVPKNGPTKANAEKLEKAPEWYNRMKYWANQNRDNLEVGGVAGAGGLLSYILARKLGARRGTSLLTALLGAVATGGLDAYRLANNKVPKFTV